jgi:uncharacterized metal-binding protein
LPSGVVHRKITLFLHLLTLPSALFVDPIPFIGLQIGLIATYFVSPDLDITTNKLGLAKYLGFETYRKLIPHRFGLSLKDWRRKKSVHDDQKTKIAESIPKVFLFSHIPLIGTVIRTVLVLLPWVITLLLFNRLEYISFVFVTYIYLGMALSDTLHIIADIFWSSVRRKL